MSETTYREVPLGEDACTECDQLVSIKYSARVQVGNLLPIWVHGPRGNRCPGGGKPGAGWLVATRLPQWDDLSDLDKGAALMHTWKAHWEASAPYATENYPARYFDHPVLTALDEKTSSRHARAVTGGHGRIYDALGREEHERLYELARVADERRNSQLLIESQKLPERAS